MEKEKTDKNIGIAAVSAGFPSSQTYREVKELETEMAVSKGATEIDIVLSVGEFLAGNYKNVHEEIKAIKKACGNAHLKVILESGSLKTADLIRKASLLSIDAGADFIKTSTGKTQPAATPEAAFVMLNAIKDYYKISGKKIGFKPAGGISTAEDAAIYYRLTEKILGEEWLNNKLFRIGASRLANRLIEKVYDKSEINYF